MEKNPVNALPRNELRKKIPAQQPKNYAELQVGKLKRQDMESLCEEVVNDFYCQEKPLETPENLIEEIGGAV
ncbi:hypothetical protein [Microbulbifer sp. VAAF005]|uniref:hypothetical protein n=1 Tax=Microbulbifer sp. VAAF005 TaxID=3034230 RepID=UPI0024AC99EA|nr:hypothetical protein [Microbulbifer sp. VAAF005]WHI46568.1 hypothetical protein P0078_23155 [Microbulbifer sp. VAAF005]